MHGDASDGFQEGHSRKHGRDAGADEGKDAAENINKLRVGIWLYCRNQDH
jgi:hypothetical protein